MAEKPSGPWAVEVLMDFIKSAISVSEHGSFSEEDWASFSLGRCKEFSQSMAETFG